jgi:hypothetical protein
MDVLSGYVRDAELFTDHAARRAAITASHPRGESMTWTEIGAAVGFLTGAYTLFDRFMKGRPILRQCCSRANRWIFLFSLLGRWKNGDPAHS